MPIVARWPLLLALLIAAAAPARAEFFGPKPLLVRIEGHVGPAREGDRRIAELNLRQDERTFPLTIDEIWVLSGDAVGLDVIHEVEQYDPSMSVAGPKEVVHRLASADPAEPLEITGYYRRGQRILMLSSVGPAKKKK
jgi:hypothetical protein